MTMERGITAYAAALTPAEQIALFGILDGFGGLFDMIASQQRALPQKVYDKEYLAKMAELSWLRFES